MLWNSIYEFFVTRIFGGYIRGGAVSAFLFGNANSNTQTYQVNVNVLGLDMSVGNYLSLIATLITIILILVLCCLFIYKIIKLVGGLIR